MKIGADTKYSALVQLTTNAEQVTWNRFYNFLTANSILILAWAAIYQSPSFRRDCGATVVLVAIPVVGMVSAVFWAALGHRGRAFLFRYIELGSMMETAENAEEVKGIKPFQTTKWLRDHMHEDICKASKGDATVKQITPPKPQKKQEGSEGDKKSGKSIQAKVAGVWRRTRMKVVRLSGSRNILIGGPLLFGLLHFILLLVVLFAGGKANHGCLPTGSTV